MRVFEIVGAIGLAWLISTQVGIDMAMFMASSMGWSAAIGLESVWLITAVALAGLLPTGIRYTIELATTLKGILLDWPELLFGAHTAYLILHTGFPNGALKPLAMALAVGASEEFLFRVLLLGWLVTRMSPPAALLTSAAVFGAAHMHVVSLLGAMNVVPQFAGGMILGAIFLRTRNPLPGILCHAFWDFPFFVAFGAGISGGSTAGGMPSPWETLMWMCFAAYGLWLVRPNRPQDGSDTAALPLARDVAGYV